MDTFLLCMLCFLGIIALTIVWMLFSFMLPWLRASRLGAPVPLIYIIGIRLRANPPKLLVDTYILMNREGQEVSICDVEATYLAYGDRTMDPISLAQLVREFKRTKEQA